MRVCAKANEAILRIHTIPHVCSSRSALNEFQESMLWPWLTHSVGLGCTRVHACLSCTTVTNSKNRCITPWLIRASISNERTCARSGACVPFLYYTKRILRIAALGLDSHALASGMDAHVHDILRIAVLALIPTVALECMHYFLRIHTFPHVHSVRRSKDRCNDS